MTLYAWIILILNKHAYENYFFIYIPVTVFMATFSLRQLRANIISCQTLTKLLPHLMQHNFPSNKKKLNIYYITNPKVKVIFPNPYKIENQVPPTTTIISLPENHSHFLIPLNIIQLSLLHLYTKNTKKGTPFILLKTIACTNLKKTSVKRGRAEKRGPLRR